MLVGDGDPIKIKDNRVKVVSFVSSENKLINLYDNSNIVILPSYTEAHPKVIDESLSRMRPVIIFDDIKYVINQRYGVFSVKRDADQLKKIINFIKINYQSINNQMKKNQLPKRNDFLKNLSKIISKD
jgi:glycosyltransferase involved in cell wall biosynthesis